MSKKGCFWISVVLLILFLAGGGLCGGIVYFAFNVIKAPIEAVVKELNEDREIAAKLGSPIESGTSFGITDMENTNGNGHADVDFNVSGSISGANVKGRVNLTANKWRSEEITVTCDDGTTFTLPRNGMASERDADDNKSVEDDPNDEPGVDE